MRINEKMGLVYTALFLTVSVAVITQNSGTLMAMFRGETGTRATSDVFTVKFGRNPVDSAIPGPITDLSGLDAQANINGRNLEITNVHLGRYAPPEKPTLQTAGAKLASVAVDTGPAFRPPASLQRLATVKGLFSMPVLSANRDTGNYRREATAEPTILSDQTALDSPENIRLPGLPDSGAAPALANLAKLGPVKRQIPHDPGLLLPPVMRNAEQSPFGTACDPQISASVVPGALVRITVKAPCHPNSRVEIRHDKLDVTLKTDHIGNLTALIPAFEQNALFSVKLARTPLMRARVKVPELAKFDRVAIQWKGGFPVRLEALEFGKPLGVGRYIPQSQLNETIRFLHRRGGFMLRLGNSLVKNPIMAVVYSLPRENPAKSGIVDFIVSVTATKASCGQARIIQSFRSRGGLLVGASGLQFKMPTCGGTTQRVVLKNVVRDLIIATK